MRILYSMLFVISIGNLLAQNQPVPSYITKQSFPDSVTSVSVLKLDGTRTTLGDMLASYHGKKVLVDIWASWCRDCIVGLPKLENLKKKTADKDVVYLFLSIDEADVKWRTAIDRFNIRGEHFRVESGWKNALSNYLVLDWVPRYLVLDEEGHVVMPKAIVADDKKLERKLLE